MLQSGSGVRLQTGKPTRMLSVVLMLLHTLAASSMCPAVCAPLSVYCACDFDCVAAAVTCAVSTARFAFFFL